MMWRSSPAVVASNSSLQQQPLLAVSFTNVVVAIIILITMFLPNCEPSLAQLSIYNDWELMHNSTYLDEWAPLLTFYRGHNLTWMEVAAATPNSRMRGMYEMRPSNIFCPLGCTNCSSPYPFSEYGLCPHWQAHVAAMATLLEPFWKSGALSSVSLPDEVGCSGRVSFEDIDNATKAIRAAVANWGANIHGQPRLYIHHNDCDVMGNPDMGPEYCKYPHDLSDTNCSLIHGNWPRVPEAIDWFSVDQYDSCHTYIGGRLGNCSLYNEEEPARVQWYYESYVFPKLASHQSTFVVPGLFGDYNCRATNGSQDKYQPLCIGFTGTDAELFELQQDMLIRKLIGYMKWINHEPRVTGMLPYTWDHHANFINASSAFMVMGASDFPKVMAELKTIAGTIIGSHHATNHSEVVVTVKTDDASLQLPTATTSSGIKTLLRSKNDDTEDANAWCVNTADSMTNVMRSDVPAAKQSQHVLSVARGEKEGVQLVIRAKQHSRGFRWAVHASEHVKTRRRGELSVSLEPVGYVHRGSYGSCPSPVEDAPNRGGTCPFNTTSELCNTSELSVDCGSGHCVKMCYECLGCSHQGAPIATPQDWWPYPILNFVDTFDVAAETSQPLLLTFEANSSTTHGTHMVAISLTDASGTTVQTEVQVNVFNFTLPSTPSILSIWGFMDEYNPRLWPTLYAQTEFQRRFVDFFLEHRFPIASLYQGHTAGWANTPAASNTAGLQQLWQRGQRILNVGVGVPDNPRGKEGNRSVLSDAEFQQIMNSTALGVAAAAQAGWPKEAMMVYVLDEPNLADVVGMLPNVSTEMKRRFGNVTVVTCGDMQWSVRLGSNGVKQDLLPHVDVFIPRCWTLANTSVAEIAAVKASGQRVGCYTSGIPYGPAGLNFFLEYPAIRARLLLGVGAWQADLDFFLYYRLNGWQQYLPGRCCGVGGVGPINASGVTPTLEVLTYSNRADSSFDGEAQMVLPGPAGPMSTLHFENMRDGFEDHAYLALLRSLCPDSTKDTVIPTRLFQETQPDPSPINRTFSEHPGDLRAWRNIVGKAIEAALANGTCDQP